MTKVISERFLTFLYSGAKLIRYCKWFVNFRICFGAIVIALLQNFLFHPVLDDNVVFSKWTARLLCPKNNILYICHFGISTSASHGWCTIFQVNSKSRVTSQRTQQWSLALTQKHYMYKLHTVERDLQILHRLWEPLTKNGNPNTTA